jgi:hypothetical protein
MFTVKEITCPQNWAQSKRDGAKLRPNVVRLLGYNERNNHPLYLSPRQTND